MYKISIEGISVFCDTWAYASFGNERLPDAFVALGIAGPRSQLSNIHAQLVIGRAEAALFPEGDPTADWTHLPARVVHASPVRKALSLRGYHHYLYGPWAGPTAKEYVILPEGDQGNLPAMIGERLKSYGLIALPEWYPWLTRHCMEAGVLTELPSHGCLAYRLTYSNDVQDAVADAIRNGELTAAIPGSSST